MDSQDYAIDYISGKGRALIARRSFACGETIFVETPLVAAQYAWNKLYEYTACDYCLRPLETLGQNLRRLLKNSPDIDRLLSILPDHDRLSEIDQSRHAVCEKCGARYCCAECMQEALAGHHQFLCFSQNSEESNPLTRLDSMWRQMHYPPETTTVELVVRLAAVVKATSGRDDSKTKSMLEVLSALKAEPVDGACHTDQRFMHKILRDDFQNQLRQLSTALRLDFNFLKPEIQDPNFFSVDWLTRVFTMIGLNGQGVGGSPFNRYVTNLQKEKELQESSSGASSESKVDYAKVEETIDALYQMLDEAVGLEFLNSEGTALYALQSACNHSCAPNARVDFPGNNTSLALVACQQINPGDEVTISYLDDCQLDRSRHSRRRQLAENYLFACECPKCVSEAAQPDVTSDEDEEEGEHQELEGEVQVEERMD